MNKLTWNELIVRFPSPHLLQTSQWANVKEHYGWRSHRLIWTYQHNKWMLSRFEGKSQGEETLPAAAALALEKRLGPGFSVVYVPKGPLLIDWADDNLRKRVAVDLENFARDRGAIQLKIDPDVPLGTGIPGKQNARETPLGGTIRGELQKRGWVFSPEQIQYRNSVLIDLTPDEEELLSEMKSKTRYNIRLAGRKGVTVREGTEEDLDTLYTMYAQTAVRAGFTIRPQAYYQQVWNEFMSEPRNAADPAAQPLLAEVEGEPTAGAVIFRFQDKAWYIHGMSLMKHSEKMPSYLIQWESMRWAKQQGCEVYDMWGAPDEFNKEDPLWGVYRFKSGFGGEVIRTIGAWDYPAKPLLYRLYHQAVPRLLDFMRYFRNRSTEEEAGREL